MSALRVFARAWLSTLLVVMVGSCAYSGVMALLFRPGWPKVAQLWLGYGLAMQLTLGTLVATASTAAWLVRGRPDHWPPSPELPGSSVGLNPSGQELT